MKFRPYFDARTKASKSGYASLSETEKWDWHGDIYGWRRVFQGISRDETSSPIDPAGDWFDPRRADIAEEHYRAEIDRQRRQRRQAYEETGS